SRRRLPRARRPGEALGPAAGRPRHRRRGRGPRGVPDRAPPAGRVPQRRKQRLGRWLRGLAGQFADDVGSPDAGPHESLERQRASRIVYRALDGLSQNQRTVVILYELEGLSGEEIAAVMETKVG